MDVRSSVFALFPFSRKQLYFFIETRHHVIDYVWKCGSLNIRRRIVKRREK